MASSSRPTSVRGLYCTPSPTLHTAQANPFPAPPSEEWLFLPPTVSPPSSTASLASPPSYLPNPFQPPPRDDELPRGGGLYAPLQLFAAEYFTTALGMPFEVGKTLLQIEYRPRRRLVPAKEEEVEETVQRDWGAEDDEVGVSSNRSAEADERIS